jgi:hypothetical protein
MQAHAWGLETKLDKFSVDFLQHQLERGPHGRLTLEMLDFAFPPNAPISTAVQARISAPPRCDATAAVYGLLWMQGL